MSGWLISVTANLPYDANRALRREREWPKTVD
jgi:hypothetical protein